MIPLRDARKTGGQRSGSYPNDFSLEIISEFFVIYNHSNVILPQKLKTYTMTTVNIYLTFNGNCEAAFDFYKSVIGGEFTTKSRFNEMPPMEGTKPLSPEEGNLLMHVSLPVSSETVLMGSDTGGEWAKSFQPGNNFSISLNTGTTAEADRLFSGLSAGGKITMPMDKTFWGSYFGMFTDKFGVNWMISQEDIK
jgi:PhnB protein